MSYKYRGTEKNDPLRETCGDKRGTNSGYTRHYRANERPCAQCAQAQADYLKRYRSGPGGDEHRRQAVARSRAKSQLVARHRDEFDALYRAAHAALVAETVSVEAGGEH